MKKVGVIIPVYNNGELIKKCIESVVSQTIFSECELICIDDGSKDDTVNILNEYVSTSNIKIIHQINSGSGSARNNGIENADSEYLMFVDGDDYLPNSYVLEKLYKGAKEKKVDVYVGNGAKNVKGKIITKYESARHFLNFRYDGFLDTKVFHYPYIHTKCLFKREYLLKNNILYPNYLRGQDIVFCAKALAGTSRIYHTSEVVYIHRQRHKKTIFTPEKACDFIMSYKDLFEISNEKGWYDLAKHSIFTMRVFSVRIWYKQIDEEGKWNIIDGINRDIKQYGKGKYKRLLNQKEYQRRGIIYNKEKIISVLYYGINFLQKSIIYHMSN